MTEIKHTPLERETFDVVLAEAHRLQATNASLLEALKKIEKMTSMTSGIRVELSDLVNDLAKTTIAKAEGKS